MAEALLATIPCEYCTEQIDLDNWESHSTQCAETNKHRVEELTRTDPSTTLIPCEYCGTQVTLLQWTAHWTECSNAERQRIEDLAKNVANEPVTTFFPCEYCQQLFCILCLEEHQIECRRQQTLSASALLPATKADDGSSENPCPVCKGMLSSNILRLQCGCKVCYFCFADSVQQRKQSNRILLCPQCTLPIKDADIRQLQIPANEIDAIRLHQQDKVFEDEQTAINNRMAVFPYYALSAAGSVFPPYWDVSSINNFSRHILDPQSTEYKFVEENFHKTLPSNKINQIERIQNRRWYRQFDAHRDSFIEKYNDSTEQWLFHGCTGEAAEGIVLDCFNRSHSVRCAVGQGIYFARDAQTSYSYSRPDANNVRRMFMARVLIGKTTTGNPTTRVCPPGFDTTGGGRIFVTYHDSQAYGEYLITFT